MDNTIDGLTSKFAQSFRENKETENVLKRTGGKVIKVSQRLQASNSNLKSAVSISFEEQFKNWLQTVSIMELDHSSQSLQSQAKKYHIPSGNIVKLIGKELERRTDQLKKYD